MNVVLLKSDYNMSKMKKLIHTKHLFIKEAIDISKRPNNPPKCVIWWLILRWPIFLYAYFIAGILKCNKQWDI